MRVVAGELKGRRIEAPAGDRTRPTTDKVREAVFNALGSLEVIEGATFLDLFAGTGAMGIEALSRGAAHCTFVENDRSALAVLRRNLDTLGVAERATVVASDALAAARVHGRVDVLVADPPYGDIDWVQLLSGADVSLAVLESGRPVDAIAGWDTVREKRYGRTHVAFLRPRRAPGTPDGASPDGTVERE
jgi:16S rRNA (guanine966-N2)-methyltransferase